MEDIYPDGAPRVWIQDDDGPYRFGPDSEGFYWGMSGSAAYPCYEIGCFTDFVFGDDKTVNEIICDQAGVQGTAQERNSLHVNFTLQSFFPLSVLTHLLRTGAVTHNATEDAEKMGIGPVTRKNNYWKMFFSRIYDPDTNDFFSVTIHKGEFIDAWEIAMPFGDKWTVPLQFKGYAAGSPIPEAQKFATAVRVDPSVLG